MTERELRLFKALVDDLRALRDDIHAIRENQQANDDTSADKPVQPIAVEITHTPDLDPARHEYYEAENRERSSTWRKLKPWVEGIAVVTALALAIFTFLNLQQVKEQTTIGEQQSRPWMKVIGVSLSAQETLSFNSNRMPLAPGEMFQMFAPVKEPIARASIRTEFHLKNIGRSVAQRVNVTAELFFSPSQSSAVTSTDSVGEEQNRFCSPPRNLKIVGPRFTRSAVFPDDDVATLITAIGWIAKGDVTRRDGSDWVTPILIGCVTYEEPKNFQTRVAYAVAGLKSNGIVLGVALDSEQIRFIRDEYHEYAQ